MQQTKHESLWSIMGKKNYHNYQGQRVTTREIQKLARAQYHIHLSTRLINKRFRHGWDIQKIITTPSQAPKTRLPKKVSYGGKTYSLPQIEDIVSKNPMNDTLLCSLITVNLIRLMNKHHTRKSELAKALHSNNSRITMYLNGQRTPNTVTMYKIANYFGVTVDYFMHPHQERID